MSSKADIIIIGGGTAGCVVASRLHQRNPALSIILIEAGADVTDHPHIYKPSEAVLLHGSDIDWKYMTVPQRHLDGKPKYNCAVKALSGGVAINTGGWIRGDKQDYDQWARDVDDDRWSYSGLLPYFKRSEHHYDPNGNPEQHGFEGPMYTSTPTSTGRKYPLRDTVRAMWSRLGVNPIDDGNSGHPQGLAEMVDNRRDGLRQLTSLVYPLHGVNVLTETHVSRILLSESKVAIGVELTDGRTLYVRAGGEVILSAGSYRTPQVLLLSGIGDAEQLAKHNIPQQVDLPDVGRNLHDHLMVFRFWKLRHPEKGLALGSPLFNDPAYQKGGPSDWIATTSVPREGLQAALEKDDDEGRLVDARHPLVQGPRSHLEFTLIYAALGGDPIGLKIPIDGTAIMNFYMLCLPTSRGSITLGSTDPVAPPVIDPNYYATETDHFVMREGWRTLSRLILETPEGKELVESEIVPEGHESLAADAPGEAIDARIKMGGSTVFHPAGTAAMGKVVDGSLKVKGVDNLRVVDASVIPNPLASHYQVAVFAIAEQAVDIILKENSSLA